MWWIYLSFACCALVIALILTDSMEIETWEDEDE